MRDRIAPDNQLNLRVSSQHLCRNAAKWQTIFLSFLGVVLGCCTLRADTAAPTGARHFDKPNVILILADDLGYGELSCQGNTQIPTTHIDSIAGSGIRFTNGYVTAPNCSPSRAGLLTGRFPTRFGYEFNPTGTQNEDPSIGLPVEQSTIADRLRLAGYVTGIVGKWHLGGTAAYHPSRRGFDEFFGFTHEGHFYVPDPWRGVTSMLRRKNLPGGGQGRRSFGNVTYNTEMRQQEPAYDANNPILRGSQPITEPAYLTDVWTREAVDFIGHHRDKPFFLYVAYNAVHSPLQATNEYMKKFSKIDDLQRRIFAAMLSNLDDSVGAVLQKVRYEGLENDTIVVFLSDNGGPTRELTSSNLPLRGGKGQMYEGGIRVPFMISWPGHLPTSKLYHEPISSVDLFASILKIAGEQADPQFDGVDFVPYLVGARKGRPHEALYWRQGLNTAFRVGDWKLLRQGLNETLGEWELYNLHDDISETNNLAASRPDMLKELLSRWNMLDAEMIKPAFGPSTASKHQK